MLQHRFLVRLGEHIVVLAVFLDENLFRKRFVIRAGRRLIFFVLPAILIRQLCLRAAGSNLARLARSGIFAIEFTGQHQREHFILESAPPIFVCLLNRRRPRGVFALNAAGLVR